MNKRMLKNDEEINEGKIFALLAYLSILCIIPLVFKKNNPFALYHGKQGLVIFIGQVTIFVVSIIIGQGLSHLLWFVLGVFSLWGVVEALRGNYVKMPLISGIAEKITL